MRSVSSTAIAILMACLAGCGEREDRASTPAAQPAAPAEPASEAEPPTVEPPMEVADGEVSFTLDGEPQRLAVREPGHATINHLGASPSMAIIASANAPSTETLIIKLGGVDLDRARLPLELRALEGGGPTVSITYVDADGARSTGQVDAGTPDDYIAIDSWDPALRHLRARFSFTVKGPSTGSTGSSHSLVGGSLDVSLHDPFAR